MDHTFSKHELSQLSHKLLQLHKALIEHEKRSYQKRAGQIESPAKFLELLMNDPHFAWLRELSGLIVGIDEFTDSKEPVDEKQITDLIAYTQGLLTGSDREFSKKYLSAIQNDPIVAASHGQVMMILKRQ